MEAIAVNNIVLRVRWNKEHVEIGSNGGSDKAFKTKDKSHLGKKYLNGGLIFIAAFRKQTSNRSKAHLLFEMADRAETLTLKEL